MATKAQLRLMICDAMQWANVGKDHAALLHLIEATRGLIESSSLPDTPHPAPSDDVYRVECKWVDGPPESPADRDTYLCDRGFGNEFLTVYYTGYGPVFCRHGLVCTPQGILKHAGPLPTGGE